MSASPAPLKDSSLSVEFETLFREHSRMVYRTAYGVTGNREDAQDILQTIFLRLLRHDVPPDARQNPKAYLYRAAVNLSLDTLKARRRRTFISHPDFVNALPAAETIEEDHRRLYKAVAALDTRSREVVILRYVHDCSDSDIARMLGKSRVAVAVCLVRARARLKRIIRGLEEEGKS
jgi:RNA polymerase sigma-70 factor (ECF subfamily)